jgi:hypothetical protein
MRWDLYKYSTPDSSSSARGHHENVDLTSFAKFGRFYHLQWQLLHILFGLDLGAVSACFAVLLNVCAKIVPKVMLGDSVRHGSNALMTASLLVKML